MMTAAVPPLPASLDTDTRLDLLSQLRLRYRLATSIAAALIVTLLHIALLMPALLDGSSRPNTYPLGSPNAIQATLIDDRSANTFTPPALSPPALQSIIVDLPDPTTRNEVEPGLAALQGRYLEQIHARIDRAWLKPRTPI